MAEIGCIASIFTDANIFSFRGVMTVLSVKTIINSEREINLKTTWCSGINQYTHGHVANQSSSVAVSCAVYSEIVLYVLTAVCIYRLSYLQGMLYLKVLQYPFFRNRKVLVLIQFLQLGILELCYS